MEGYPRKNLRVKVPPKRPKCARNTLQLQQKTLYRTEAGNLISRLSGVNLVSIKLFHRPFGIRVDVASDKQVISLLSQFLFYGVFSATLRRIKRLSSGVYVCMYLCMRLCVRAVIPLAETSGLRRRDQFLNEAASGLRHRSQNLNPMPHDARTSLISNRNGILLIRD